MLKLKKLKILGIAFSTLMVLLSFNNCSKLDGSDGPAETALLSNAVANGEKAVYIWNTVTYELNPVVVFANRTAFQDAIQISWTLYHDKGSNCEIEDSPTSDVKDWIRFNCDGAGKLDVVMVAHIPKGAGDNYSVQIFETTIYLKESTVRDSLGRTTPVIQPLADIFPNGDINAPSTNISGGGGYDPVGSGSDIDPRFLRGLQVYSERCAVCHDITGDPNGNGNNDNARRYFRLRRDYYAEFTTGSQNTRESRAIAAALRRIRIGLASDTFAMWRAPEVQELFVINRDPAVPNQMDAFSFNGSKNIFGNAFQDIQTKTEATSNNITGLRNVFRVTTQIPDPDPLVDSNGDGDPTNDTSSVTNDFGLNLSSNNQGLSSANNTIPNNVDAVRVLRFNSNGTLRNGTDEFPVVTDIFVEPDVNGQNEVFRIPRADFDYATYQEDLEALIIYIVETL